MKPEELVLTIIDMHQRGAPMATIFTVAARALAAERERCARVAEHEAEEAGRIFDEAREAAEIARLIISQWYKVPNLYFGSEGLQAELNDIAAIVQSYGDERARQERERCAAAIRALD